MGCNSVSGSSDGIARTRIVARCSTVFLGLVVGTGLLWGQEQGAPAIPAKGLQIYSISAYGVYYSAGLPENLSFQGPTNLGADVGIGTSTRIGWMKSGERSNFSFMYTPSYTGRVRYAGLNALNHDLSFTASRKLTPRWKLGFSVAANLSNLAEMLFSPTVFSTVTSVPANFDDLSGAMLAGKYTNAQLASVLTGAPLIESPARNLLYGERMFMAGLQSSLSYSHSPRLSVNFSAGGGRSQHVSDGGQNVAGVAGTQTAYLLPNTTTGSANLGVSYSLSPRTQIGAAVGSMRIVSQLEDAYITTSTASWGRTMGRRWFVQLHGGGGFIKPIRLTFLLPSGLQYVAGGSLGFKTFSHTFLGSYDRNVGDSYGFNAGSTVSVSVAWRWDRPGRRWWLEGSFGRQRLQGITYGDITSWRGTAGFGRTLRPHLALLTQYVYLNYGGGLGTTIYSQSQSAVRVSVVWTPRPQTVR